MGLLDGRDERLKGPRKMLHIALNEANLTIKLNRDNQYDKRYYPYNICKDIGHYRLTVADSKVVRNKCMAIIQGKMRVKLNFIIISDRSNGMFFVMLLFIPKKLANILT